MRKGLKQRTKEKQRIILIQWSEIPQYMQKKVNSKKLVRPVFACRQKNVKKCFIKIQSSTANDREKKFHETLKSDRFTFQADRYIQFRTNTRKIPEKLINSEIFEVLFFYSCSCSCFSSILQKLVTEIW